MTTLLILFSIWLFFAMVYVWIEIYEENYTFSETLTILIFIFCFPLYLVLRIIWTVKRKKENHSNNKRS